MSTTLVVKDLVNETLIDSTKTVYNIVSSVYPKDDKDVILYILIHIN